MPVYEYTALDIKGKTISGIIDADNSRTARQKLRASRTYPVSIEEVHDTAAIKAPQDVFGSTPIYPDQTPRSFNDDKTAGDLAGSRPSPGTGHRCLDIPNQISNV